MLKSLLIALSLTTVAGTAMADVTNVTAVPASLKVTTSTVKAPKHAVHKKLAKGASMSIREDASNAKVKQLSLPFRNIANPMLRTKTMVKAPAGASFFESFEGTDMTEMGWTLESTGEFKDETTPWAPESEGLSMLGITPPDGSSVAMINYNSNPVEEWLISPEITVGTDELLSFWSFISPAFFNSMDNINWDSMSYDGDPVRIGDLDICVRENGGEWTKLLSVMDTYAGKSFSELLSIAEGTFSVSLADYEGKTIQVAFKYWGTDCNSLAIDAVTVAKPSLEGVIAMEPLEMLYWGCDRTATWGALNLTLAQAPVMAELTWQNYTDFIEGATYSWSYHDPATNDMAVSSEETLVATYQPDFTSDFTRRNNLYYAPSLIGSAPGASDGTYTRGYDYFQAGGKPEFEVNGTDGGKVLMNFGLMPYPLNIDGNTVLTIDDSTIGDPAIPVFGHNANTDKYWLNYTLNGEEPSESDDVRLNGYLNFVYAPGKPLVVTGTHALALGQISEGVNFRCDIYKLAEDFSIDDSNIIATAYCPFSQVQIAEQGTNDLLNIVFDFDTPVILDNEKAPAYVVKISGFNCDAVSYFAPVQSDLPDPVGLCYGYVEKLMNINGYTEGYTQSFSPIAYVEGPHGDCYNAFAINLDGYYPYIACDTQEVEVAPGTPAEVVLGSYYDGAHLNIETPEGITATAAGRYDSCLLTINATRENAQGTINVSAPGVEHKIEVKATTAISSITAGDAAIEAVYTLDGRSVEKDNIPAGFYIVRRTDGTTSKAIIR